MQEQNGDQHQSSPIDVHVGSRIRLRRNLLNRSQESLARELGITFQQVQKYERGINRVGASRLFDLSKILDVPIQFFFDDMPAAISGAARAAGAQILAPQTLAEQDLLKDYRATTEEGRKLVSRTAVYVAKHDRGVN